MFSKNLIKSRPCLMNWPALKRRYFEAPDFAKPKIAVISAKMNSGQQITGTNMAPEYLAKKTNLFRNLRSMDYVIVDYGTVEENAEGVQSSRARLEMTAMSNHRLVQRAIMDDCVPLVLGGDHSLGIGSVHGSLKGLRMKSAHSNYQANRMGLLWIDAHADINTPLTSASGNIHGQSVSYLLDELHEAKLVPMFREFEWVREGAGIGLSTRNIVYIGLRDIDPYENVILKKFKIKAYSMSDIQELGIGRVIDESIRYLQSGREKVPLHVSLDIDALDPWYAPSTGTPVLGGLSLPELMLIGNRVHESRMLRSLDIVEVNPLISSGSQDVKKTLFSAERAILSFFGYRTLGAASKEHWILPTAE